MQRVLGSGGISLRKPMIPELSLQNVRIANPEHVTEVIENMIRDGHNKLQVVADFDRTLSKYTH